MDGGGGGGVVGEAVEAEDGVGDEVEEGDDAVPDYAVVSDVDGVDGETEGVGGPPAGRELAAEEGFGASEEEFELLFVVGGFVAGCVAVEEGPEEKVSDIVALDLGWVGVEEPDEEIALPVGDVGDAALKQDEALRARQRRRVLRETCEAGFVRAVDESEECDFKEQEA